MENKYTNLEKLSLEELEKMKNELITELNLIDDIEQLEKNIRTEILLLEKKQDLLENNILTDEEVETLRNDFLAQQKVTQRIISELKEKKQQFEKIK